MRPELSNSIDPFRLIPGLRELLIEAGESGLMARETVSVRVTPEGFELVGDPLDHPFCTFGPGDADVIEFLAVHLRRRKVESQAGSQTEDVAKAEVLPAKAGPRPPAAEATEQPFLIDGVQVVRRAAGDR